MPSSPAHRVNKVADGQFRGENRQISETNAGWLETEWSEGQTKEAGRSDHSETLVDPPRAASPIGPSATGEDFEVGSQSVHRSYDAG